MRTLREVADEMSDPLNPIAVRAYGDEIRLILESPEMVDSLGLPFTRWLFKRAETENFCPRCEGDGSYSKLADCTTYDTGCACNGARVNIDPCDMCGGSGEWPDAGVGRS